MNIYIFYEGVNFRLRGWKKIKQLVAKVITEEGNFSGDLNFIVATDRYIRIINAKYLNHKGNTDVISFSYGMCDSQIGEVYISLDTVKRNALNYKVSYNLELLRVIIHGVLHICGYEDTEEEEKIRIHAREDYWIDRYRSD